MFGCYSMNMKETIVSQCLDVLKRDDIKYHLRVLFSPIIELMVIEMNPYIYVALVLIFLIFMLLLAILSLLILILRNKNLIIAK
jgi:hypothetical protein